MSAKPQTIDEYLEPLSNDKRAALEQRRTQCLRHKQGYDPLSSRPSLTCRTRAETGKDADRRVR